MKLVLLMSEMQYSINVNIVNSAIIIGFQCTQLIEVV